MRNKIDRTKLKSIAKLDRSKNLLILYYPLKKLLKPTKLAGLTNLSRTTLEGEYEVLLKDLNFFDRKLFFKYTECLR